MSETRIPQRWSGPGNRWLLPAILALLVIAIVAGAYVASHRGSSSKTPTPTVTPTTTSPTPIPTATASRSRPTATPSRHVPTPTPHRVVTHPPRPTATPRPRPTPTPRPTSTPHPTASPTPTLTTGTIPVPSNASAIQQGADQGNAADTIYLDPFKVVSHDLPKYGFKTVTIVQPTPVPSPTAYTGNSGLPEVQMTVQYQGKRYLIVLDQPEQQGPKGIWVIVRIKAL